MTATETINQTYQDNLDYTLFSWAPQQSTVSPIDAVNAEGVYVYDRDGKAHIDFSSQLMNVNVGHNNQDINDAH